MNCPKCTGVLYVKKGRFGEFWGCSKFPRCRHTQRVEKHSSAAIKVSRHITKQRRIEQKEQKRLAREANKRI